jgi:hypothetical protein
LQRLRRELFGDSIRSLHEPAFVYQIVSHDLGAHGSGRMEHNVGLLQAPQGLPRHGPEPTRTGLYDRVQDAPKSVEVVTEDSGSSARQDVHDIRVGMIAHVVKIEAIALAPEEPGIVPKPVQQAIRVKRCP